MATLKNSVVGREVFDKVNGLPGVVAREDGLTLVIRFFDGDGIPDFKIVSAARFRRDFRFTDGEYNMADRLLSNRKKNEQPDEKPQGELGCSTVLKQIFVSAVKAFANQDLEITSDSSGKNFLIKYNGFVVFRLYLAKRSLDVICNEKSLSPKNRRLCKHLEGRRPSQSAQFVFTKRTESPLMRSIIVDGLYFRQVIDEGEK